MIVDNIEKALASLPPIFVKKISSRLKARGKECYLVGGSVRDCLLGREVKEYDLATDATPQEVMQMFKHTVPTGIKHGTVLILMGDEQAEITTFRSESTYSDLRHPDEVFFADTIEEDVKRRDFTVNAMALNVESLALVDEHGGIIDLQNKIIRTVGEPIERFEEDGLRLMRACRFAAKLGFDIEENTAMAMTKCLHSFNGVSMERVREELNGILASDEPYRGIELLRECGILEIILPELTKGYGIEQNRFHAYDVYYHNLRSCSLVEKTEDENETVLIRLAALMHDIGKTFVKRKVDTKEEEVFYNHEVVGARLTRKIMKRLKYSRADSEYVENLVRNHMFYYQNEWTDGAVRRFIRNVGLDNIRALLRLRQADRMGSGKKKDGESKAISRLLSRIDKILEEENAFKVTDLAIGGTDIMNEFEITPGPIIGKTLKHLLERVLDEPNLNERQHLLNMSEKYLRDEGMINDDTGN